MLRRLTLTLAVAVASAGPALAQEPPAGRSNLVTVYQEAALNNADLAASRADFQARREIVPQARAGLLPNLSAGAGATDSRTKVDTSAGEFSSSRSGIVYQASLSQPLFRADRWFQLQAAEAVSEQASLELSATEQNLILNSAEAYFAVLRAQDNLAATKAEESAFKRQMDQANERFDVGLSDKTDVLQAQAGYDSARVNRILAERRVADAVVIGTPLGMLGETDLSPRLQSVVTTFVVMIGALFLMLPVSWVYMAVRRSTGYAQSIVQTMLVLPIVVAGVVLVVRNSLALAFSLAAIMAGVRFRNNLRDPRDTVFIFLSIGVGLAAGVQALTIAAVLSLVFNVLILTIWRTNFGRSPLNLAPRAGWAEQDPADWWSAADQGVRDVVAAVGDLARRAGEASGVRVGVTVVDDRPAVSTPLEHPVVRALHQAHESVVGAPAVYGGVPGSTDGTILSRDADLATVVYGPGGKWIAHQADEFVEVDFSDVREFEIPVVMFMGRHDYTTPSQLTADWLDVVEAPFKRGVWFERSAHMAPWEEPGKTLVSLLEVVRPLVRE